MPGMKKVARFLLISCAVLAPMGSARAAQAPVSRVVFGSCAGQGRPQPFWSPINELHPDLFVFLGDNIYADTVDPAMLRTLYGKLGEQPGYQRLRHSSTTIMSTWDDHDYGYNDAGAEHPRKVESQKEFLDFFGVPADSPRRKQLGVYNSRIFGPVGQRVQVILLDMRYFRTPLRKNRKTNVYLQRNDPDSTFLGAQQWAWLKDRLREPAEVRLIGSSIQLVDDQHPYEKWSNFPLERAKLLQAIRDAKASGVIVLSGDRHQAEISIWRRAVGYDLYDITSSSFNKPFERENRGPVESNMYRVGPVIRDANFGVVNIDWKRRDPQIALEIHDSSGTLRLRETVPLSHLSAR